MSTHDSAIRGIALLGNRLFVLHTRLCDQLDELDAHDLQLQRRLTVPDDSRHLSDMASCQRRCRLYISHSTSNCIHVLVMAGGEYWTKWATDGAPWGLSVTPDSANLLVTLRYDGLVDEYSSEGRRLRRFKLRDAFSPWQAIQLGSLPFEPELFVVGHGDRTDDAARVSLMRVDGGVCVGERWYGGRPGNSEHLLSRPQHLAIGRDGAIAVADTYNDRIVLLDNELRRIGVVESTELDRQTGWLTSRVCWISRRLCVAEVLSVDGKFNAARLVFYDLHCEA